MHESGELPSRGSSTKMPREGDGIARGLVSPGGWRVLWIVDFDLFLNFYISTLLESLLEMLDDTKGRNGITGLGHRDFRPSTMIACVHTTASEANARNFSSDDVPVPIE